MRPLPMVVVVVVLLLLLYPEAVLIMQLSRAQAETIIHHHPYHQRPQLTINSKA
jgi:hypothetical protein